MKHITKAFIIGRVGKITPFNDVTKISIASDDPYKDRETGEWHKRTRWNTVSVFREGLRKYVNEKLAVGTLIQVEGQMFQASYGRGDDLNYTIDIPVEELNVLSKLPGKKDATPDS